MDLNRLSLSYAEDFVSFFIKQISDLKNVKNIILFGSVARGEATEKSDVDLFIELFASDKKVTREIEGIKKDFFESMRFKQYWALQNINNELNIMVGTFEEWRELKNSVISNGILLYGKFNALPDGKNALIVSWRDVKPNAKRVYFNKKIFGYTHHQKHYPGILQRYSGQKLGKGAILIPTEAQKEIQDLLKKFKISTKILKVLEYH